MTQNSRESRAQNSATYANAQEILPQTEKFQTPRGQKNIFFEGFNIKMHRKIALSLLRNIQRLKEKGELEEEVVHKPNSEYY